jgi:hypothetical protein
MSFIVSVDRKSQCPDAICKYEVHAYRPDAVWGIGPFDFELDRKSILNDFQLEFKEWIIEQISIWV